MKKFLVVLSALVCILGLSVISSASTVYKPEQHSFVHEENGHYVLDVDIKASEFTEEQLSFWNTFTDALTGNSSEYVPFIIYFKNLDCLDFVLLESYYIKEVPSFASGAYLSSSSAFSGCLRISISSGNVLSFFVLNSLNQFFYVSSLDSSSSGLSYVFWGYNGLVSHADSIESDRFIGYVDWDGMRLQIQDDLGEDEPEEPDPPSSSSPAWIPPVVSDPVIPEGDEYVFYDTKILGLFLNHVRTQIVHAANVGWLIFGFILVWHVVKRVIKAFSSR